MRKRKQKARPPWVLYSSLDLDSLERRTAALLLAIKKHRVVWAKNKDVEKIPTKAFLRSGGVLRRRVREMLNEVGDQYIGPILSGFY